MAETEARIGYGTIFEFGDENSPPGYTPVAEVRNITGPNMSRETPDATHMQSPDGYREFLSGLKDGGEVTLELAFLPENATQDQNTGVLSLFESGARRSCRITWAGPSPNIQWVFTGLVQTFQPAAPVDDSMTLSVTFKVSGKPEFI